MNTQIRLTYKGDEYVLEFNRMTIKMLEQSGFVAEEFMKKPLNNIELVFAAAFIKNHPKIQQSVIDEIFKLCSDKNSLIAALNIMINETYESLLSNPDEDESGNVSWEVIDLSPKKKDKNQG